MMILMSFKKSPLAFLSIAGTRTTLRTLTTYRQTLLPTYQVSTLSRADTPFEIHRYKEIIAIAPTMTRRNRGGSVTSTTLNVAMNRNGNGLGANNNDSNGIHPPSLRRSRRILDMAKSSSDTIQDGKDNDDTNDDDDDVTRKEIKVEANEGAKDENGKETKRQLSNRRSRRTTSSNTDTVGAKRKRRSSTASKQVDGVEMMSDKGNTSDKQRKGKTTKTTKRTSTTRTRQRKSPNSRNTPNHSNHNNSSKDGNDSQEQILLTDLSPLEKGTVIKRPSATIRSPYVADVKLHSDDTVILAHAPALDVGGLCSPGATVYLSRRRSVTKAGKEEKKKTSHAIELVLAPGPHALHHDGDGDGDNDDTVLVGAHPRLGELLAQEVLKRGLLQHILQFGPASPNHKPKNHNHNDDDENHHNPRVTLNKQCTYGDSRVDFELIDHSTNRRALLEVKNVVCSDYASSNAPRKTGPNHCVIVVPDTEPMSDYTRSALFPWGRVGQTFEGQKVVSARAIKHVRNLVNLKEKSKSKSNSSSGDGDGIDGDASVQPVVLFVVNRSDCEQVRTCHEACPVFAAELKRAAERGCLVVAFRVSWTPHGKAYFDGVLPVHLE